MNIIEGFFGYSKAILGIDESPYPLVLQRKTICDKCEHKSMKTDNLFSYTHCKKCGCSLDKKLKLKSSKCPVGKW